MPIFDYKCQKCGAKQRDVFVRSVRESEHLVCRICEGPLTKMISHVHVRVGNSVDSQNPGKVIQEKNEQLKRRESGYHHEERHLREDVERRVREKSK